MSIHFCRWDEPLPDVCRGGAVTIGNFDGVHRGHQALLGETRRQAQTLSAPAVAVTFHPHPLELLRPEHFQPLLTTVACRTELMEDSGADQVVVLSVTQRFLELSAHDFFELVLGAGLDARTIVEGPNFGFGHRREGNIDLLQRLCNESGRKLVVVTPVEQSGKPISSSRVRGELLRGDVRAASELLGRPFRLIGLVVQGQRRGQALGFPTANLERILTLIPADGVYAARVWVQGRWYKAAVHIGPNATFAEKARKVEVHLLDFQGGLYGQALAVHFVERLRDTRAFADARALVEQLNMDVARARELLAIQ